VFVVYFTQRWKVLSASQRRELGVKFLIWGSLGFVIAMIAMGRTSWITGLLVGLIAIASRLSQLAIYVPVLKKLFPHMKTSPPKHDTFEDMTRQQAADVLGVSIDANVDEVRFAHKRLIQKLHPDRGGSDLLAKQINQAKDILISS